MDQPKRDYQLPIWEWTDACFETEQRRLAFLKVMSKKTTPFSENELAVLHTCGKYHDIDTMLNTPYLLVFDTETTGLSVTDEIIQLGYVVFNRQGKALSTYEEVWCTTKQSHPAALKVHGLSSALVQASTKSAETELPVFMALVKQVNRVVAHNAVFDVRMLKQTADAHHCEVQLDDVFCTMKALKAVSESARGGSVKLEKVYTHLNGPELTGYHTALVDSQATAFVYYKGLENKWWS
jgi:DNA polymerase III epsilon subunit-like protein